MKQLILVSFLSVIATFILLYLLKSKTESETKNKMLQLKIIRLTKTPEFKILMKDKEFKNLLQTKEFISLAFVFGRSFLIEQLGI